MQNKPSMQEFVMQLLNEKLPANYTYHNNAHTLDVQAYAQDIAVHEGCNAEEQRLLNAAALWHDTGFIEKYAGHEEASCVLAAKYLPEFGYSNDEINSITAIIMATKLPQSATGKLEKIIADADLAYLGSADAAEKANLLFKEFQSLDSLLTEHQWNATQIAFLSSHRYFTAYCQQTKEAIKQAYLVTLKS